jgi:lauroyl/myristoyl acyltransferase
VSLPAGVARLSRAAGAKVVPATVVREGTRIVVRLGRPLEPGADESDEAFTQRVIEVLEPPIDAYPEQVNPQLARLLASGPPKPARRRQPVR